MIEYVNKWKNVRFRCAGIAQPGSRDEVVSLVNEARKAGRRLKAVGGGHSFNNNVKTEDILVDLNRLNRVVAIDAGRGTATLEAGITLSDAIVALDAAGLHFPSLGSWSAQSIAGAIATSTHGSTLHHGTLSDIVLGVEAVLSDGSVIETAGDDVRMKALRTSLGQLAFLTRVEIACTPAFMLACAIRVVPEEEGFATIGAIAHTEEYASMLWLPYVEQACIRVLRRTDARTRDQTAIDRAEAAVHRTRLDKTFEDLKDYVTGKAFLRLPRLFAELLGPRPRGLPRRRRRGRQVVQYLPLRQVSRAEQQSLFEIDPEHRACHQRDTARWCAPRHQAGNHRLSGVEATHQLSSDPYPVHARQRQDAARPERRARHGARRHLHRGEHPAQAPDRGLRGPSSRS